MFSLQDMPSASTIFSAYASMTGTMMLVRSMVNELVPHPVRGYLVSTFQYLFKPSSSQLTLIIEERNGMVRNQVYEASENYLCTKISPEAKCLKITKTPKEKKLTIRFEKGERFVDSFEGVVLKWRFICAESESSNDPRYSSRTEKRYFELSFNVKHREKVLESYLPFVLNKSKAMKDEEKVVKLYTLGSQHSCGGVPWESINLEHPSTFDTLAMDPKEKRSVMEDLDRFVRRKEFYKRVGRAWKRGYLLYGPPGTGKSSLIAAMANYLKFDVYDLQLANVMRDSDLRRLLLATTNRSILVIEDIDCSVELPDRQQHENANGRKFPDPQLTLSGLLNFIDGLWSSCGDERIIIFTTNHKERLDPALLRPGRMDLHIHMSYCTAYGFKLLASNYLGICGHHWLFEEIEGLLENTKVTPAQVAEELMKSEDAEIALGELVKLLKRKKDEGEDEPTDEVAKKLGIRRAKRQKIGNKLEKSVKNCTRRGTRRRNL